MFGSALDTERVFDHPGVVTHRTHVRRRMGAVLVSVALLAAVSGQVAHAMGAHDRSAGTRRTYVVRPGDTLWSIATRFEPSRDPRLVIEEIESVNRIDAEALIPGQELAIPLDG
jgi:LysM repeat protein